MKRVYALILLLTVALLPGCSGAGSQPTPTPAPTEAPTPAPTMDIENTFDVLVDDLVETFKGDYDIAVNILKYDEGYGFWLTITAVEYIPDEVFADYVAGFAPYVVLRAVEYKLPVAECQVSAEVNTDDVYEYTFWSSGDGMTGTLWYGGTNEKIKKVNSDITPDEVQDILGTAGLSFYD